MKKITVTLLTLILFTTAKAQLGKSDIFGGGGINATAYLTDDGLASGLGYNLRAGVNFLPKLGVVLNFNQSFPIKFTSEQYAYAYGSGGSIDATIVRKVKFIDANVRANAYMAGTADEGLGFYGFVGAGILSYKERVESVSYNTDLYYTIGGEDQTIGLMIGGGLGLQYRSGIFAGFFETGFNLPANEANGEEIPTLAVINAGVTLGVKIYLGESDR